MDNTTFTIGADVSCADGDCGSVSRIVVDPVARTVTHLVVEPKGRLELSRLVPLNLVDVADDQIGLRCTLADFEKLDPAEETRSYRGVSQAVTYDTLPLGEVAVRRGERVHRRGDRACRRPRHRPAQPPRDPVLLKEGHLWDRKEVAIPIRAVTDVQDGIRLDLTAADGGNDDVRVPAGSLTGMFDDHHGELAGQLLDQIAFLGQWIAQLGARTAALAAAMPGPPSSLRSTSEVIFTSVPAFLATLSWFGSSPWVFSHQLVGEQTLLALAHGADVLGTPAR